MSTAPPTEQPPQQTLSAKEIKKLARPIFDASPDTYYPTAVFRRWGFSRAECPKCHHHFWRHTEAQTLCGDSACAGCYSFIGTGVGVGQKGVKLTYAGAWEGFKRAFESAPIPHTAIARYPVVARWRDDVDFVAAGIFCFQPGCVTGAQDPPANPLICCQPCMRFNDLDSIGLSGRHYSCFNMLGIQVFNKPGNFIYFKEEIIEFNLRWLTQELQIDLNDITFIEDVWAGGGNLGPCVEYFIKGMEVGNMVFMQFKTFPNGTWEPLKVQVIDVGIGLERIPFLVNGSATSYIDVFPEVLQYLTEKLHISFNSEIWSKYGPYACLLNIDECENIDATWESIAQRIGVPRAELQAAVEPFRDLFVVADHTRTIQVALADGALPQSTGGGSNLRNVLRRVFDVLKRRGWWEKLGMEGLMEIFRLHAENLGRIYGRFPENKSFEMIIRTEYEKWLHTDAKVKGELDRLVKKCKGNLTPADWLKAMVTCGIDPGKISELCGIPIPPTLYMDVAELQEKNALKAKEVATGGAQLYSNDTIVLPATEELIYTRIDPATGCELPITNFQFDGKVLKVLPHHESHQLNQIVLDRTLFYPLSGGQDHDTGILRVPGLPEPLRVVEVNKYGHCLLHRVEPALTADQVQAIEGHEVHGEIDVARRRQLMAHHTATHLIHYAAHKVLGPHVWQASAKKTIEEAHLDITHFLPLKPSEEQAIEREANLAIFAAAHIKKYPLPKEEAERRHGFQLYQGGVVPGKTVRVVQVEGFDVEACCGTHCDNTAEVGMIRLIRTHRVSDGAVRLHFVAGLRALEYTQQEAETLRLACEVADVQPDKLVDTINRFFEDSKRAKKQDTEIPELQLRILAPPAEPLLLLHTAQADATMFKSLLPNYATRLREAGRAVAVVGPTWLYGILGWSTPGVTAAPAKGKKGAAAAAPAPEAPAATATPAPGPAAAAGRFDPHVLEPIVAVPNAAGKKGTLLLQGQVKSREHGSVEGVTEFASYVVAQPAAVEAALTAAGFVVLQ